VGIEEIFRARGVGFSADAGSGCGVDVPRFPGCKFTLVSGVDLKASFVENIRVSRFVIDNFSVAASGVGSRCGSERGSARPLGTVVRDAPPSSTILSRTRRWRPGSGRNR
jgi:hypothetical protein